jgi:two-component system, LuxR family, response regulator FixJ
MVDNPPGADGPRRKVFVVDDDEAVRDSLRVLLEVHDIEVEEYGSTSDFARNYRRPPRGCLILDQHLPVQSGVDFLNTPAGRGLGIPVILITGRGERRSNRSPPAPASPRICRSRSATAC